MEITDDVLAEAAPRLRAALTAAALPSLRLTTAGECAGDTAGTRLGGLPLLVAGTAWPCSPSGRAQCFLGQLNSDDVNARFGAARLPAGTVLSFFYDWVEQRWGFDPADAGHWRVLATPVDGAVAVSGTADSFTAHAVTATVVRTVPDLGEPPVEPVRAVSGEATRHHLPRHHGWARGWNPVDAFYRATGAAAGVPVHRVFGWPDVLQGPMELECQLAANGVRHGNPAGPERARVAELRPGAADWVLLWQIDTDDALEWRWADAGRLYYWIRRRDLAAGAFERCWVVLQCP
ncbi:YwqG family protein [Actinoplanes teichomyceticus]|uniref:Uncharacterized protein YwqG n=1 Tax=Actinoplanes teichomyceticus TaxID=1867 RepID=A0A561WJJ7_ACTTI|nr:YwqG family protein [Actinoplanes teichomyceticus]TWG24056.1 uncharacterized protein YwqG [Actinoplanes teichomyceticus]